MPTSDPKARFSDRVADYVRYRPGYPKAVADGHAVDGSVTFEYDTRMYVGVLA